MKLNQVLHLAQWLVMIIIMVLFLIFVPVWMWVKLAVIGTAFLIGFLLRVSRRYTGNFEPPLVDILTAVIAYLSIIIFIFIKDWSVQLTVVIIIPFLVLIPHFVYIVMRKDIDPPGLSKIVCRLFKKSFL